jgi:hypothetical protein
MPDSRAYFVVHSLLAKAAGKTCNVAQKIISSGMGGEK